MTFLLHYYFDVFTFVDVYLFTAGKISFDVCHIIE